MNRLQKFARKVNKNNTGNCYILKCDVKKFFDSIDHDILISLIQNKIKDYNPPATSSHSSLCSERAPENLIWLIKEIIKSFSTSLNKGLPLGNITSQLFANICLNELDRFIKHKLKIKYYIRYCDDFVILSDNKKYLEELILKINNFLKEKLKLSLHSDKISIRKYHQGIDYLGYVSFPYYRILRTKTKRKMFRKIEERMKELKVNKISEESFNQTLQSYLGILKHCNSYKLKLKIISTLYENFRN